MQFMSMPQTDIQQSEMKNAIAGPDTISLVPSVVLPGKWVRLTKNRARDSSTMFRTDNRPLRMLFPNAA
jgi:hypothetical protein